MCVGLLPSRDSLFRFTSCATVRLKRVGVMETIMNASKSKSQSKGLSTKKGTFNAQAFLDSAGVARTVRLFKGAEIIFSQGTPAESVTYRKEGAMRIAAQRATADD